VAQYFGHNLGVNSFGQKEQSKGITQTVGGEVRFFQGTWF
jgi:hypothetical protein